MKIPVTNWIIAGSHNDQKPFRPSDWAGRICELGCFVQTSGIVQYSEELRPIKYNGNSAVFVDADLKSFHEEVWEQVMSFARLHQLKVIEHADPVAAFHKLEPKSKSQSNYQLELQDKIELAQLAA
jgi:tRNA(Ile2) C34 agmatinyltransferase TiaS